MTMNAISADREERRRAQKELAEQLKASGALDDIFAKIDAGSPLTGDGGLLGGMLKAALERGLDAELSEHLGYDRGDPAASAFENSRNGTTSKTVSTEVGDLELAVPRDRNGTFTPMLVPKGQRRLDGLDGMIISLYAGGMTVRDIDHLLATRGSAPSSPSRRPARWTRCPRWSPPTGIVVKVRDGANVGNRAAHTPSGSTRTASGASWGSGFSPVRARSSGCRCGPIWPTATSLCRTSAATA